MQDLQKSEDHGLCLLYSLEGIDHPDLAHCTIKYFDKNFKEDDKVLEIIKAYFKKHPFEKINKVFDQLDHFGESEDVRVLRPKNKSGLHADLKDELDELYPDKFPIWKPHISVSSNVDKIDIPLNDCILIRGSEVLFSASGLHKGELSDYNPLLKSDSLADSSGTNYTWQVATRNLSKAKNDYIGQGYKFHWMPNVISDYGVKSHRIFVTHDSMGHEAPWAKYVARYSFMPDELPQKDPK